LKYTSTRKTYAYTYICDTKISTTPKIEIEIGKKYKVRTRCIPTFCNNAYKDANIKGHVGKNIPTRKRTQSAFLQFLLLGSAPADSRLGLFLVCACGFFPASGLERFPASGLDLARLLPVLGPVALKKRPKTVVLNSLYQIISNRLKERK
jgi:hypothetical protein